MTKADWLDFFEAINGRSATEEEIAAALAAGLPVGALYKTGDPRSAKSSSATTSWFCEWASWSASSFC